MPIKVGLLWCNCNILHLKEKRCLPAHLFAVNVPPSRILHVSLFLLTIKLYYSLISDKKEPIISFIKEFYNWVEYVSQILYFVNLR